MKKSFIYGIALALFAIASIFIILKYKNDKVKKEEELLEVVPRKGNTLPAEWTLCKNASSALIKKIKNNPADIKSLLGLTALYLQEARTSGNFSYYDRAAMNCVNLVLKKDADNFEALTYKAMIFLSQHHFADGLNVATRAEQMYPYNAFIYGILTDANIELGNYTAALEKADKMISIRPDIRSYARVSYLREIHGDIPGAIEAMKLAVDAGAPGTEGTEWARVQLGKLYEQAGEMKYAAMQYTIALNNRHGYPHALAGLARIASGEQDYKKAIELYLKADSASNDYSFREGLSEAYVLSGDKDKSVAVANSIVDEMERAAKAAVKNDSAGHYADREMAYAYLAVNNYDKALEHATLEYNRRPGNNDANETLAWCYYYKKEYNNALTYIKAAMKTNCRNPVLLCRAGLIYAKAGNKLAAKNYLQEALKNNPDISMVLKSESEQVFKSLM